ncbi:MAG: proline--tRNA ligase [Endomicrobium sp.]|jgi:prolyl-tRNA synthetase|nr:proline--tRNA ligase [Endomicrobium sp.]
MFFSKLFIHTSRETSHEHKREAVSIKLMIKSGMVHKLSSGFYEFLPIGLKVLRKIENIIRQEMNVIGGQEIMLPLISPKSLLVETGRWDIYGKELFKFKDRNEAEFCLSPTAEEVAVDLIRKKIKSYKQLPIMIYQFGVKFRDEIRPRFGLIRSKEFLMKDAYSFHKDENDLKKHYQIVFDAYVNICLKCGIKFRAVEAVSGIIGGSFSHEFIAITNSGEEEIVWCDCGYGVISEKAEAVNVENQKEIPLSMEEILTTNIKTIKDVANILKLPLYKFIKTVIYVANNQFVAVLIRGDHEINETKLKSILDVNKIILANKNDIIYSMNIPIGFIGPVGLKNIKIIADLSVIEISNAVTGANKKNYHIKNVNYIRDFVVDIVADIRRVKCDDFCPKCKKEKLKFSKGIEIGHTFKLGIKYSHSMNAIYFDKKGNKKNIVMGCYGIGITRMIAAIIEQSHDDSGIIWPCEIAPFEVIVIPVNFKNEKIKKISKKIYNDLSLNGLDVLIDDREESVGVKFKDADLMGIPYKITVGEKNLSYGNVELKARKDKKNDIKILKTEIAIREILKIFKK